MSEEKESSLVEMKEPKGATRAITIGMFAAFGVFILALIAGFLPTFFGQKKIMKVADAKPLEIIYTVTQADYQNTLKKITHFLAKADEVEKLELLLDAKDLNALLAYEPLTPFWRGRFQATIKDGLIEGPMSVHLPERMRKDGKEYFNSYGYFEAVMKKDKPCLQFKTLKHKGEEIELDIVYTFTDVNLFEYLRYNEQFQEDFSPVLNAMEKVKNFSITEDNKLSIRNWVDKREVKHSPK